MRWLGGGGRCSSREEVSLEQIKVTLYLLVWSDLKGSEGRRERVRVRGQYKSSKAVCERYVREVTEGVVKGAWPAQLKLPVHLSG